MGFFDGVFSGQMIKDGNIGKGIFGYLFPSSGEGTMANASTAMTLSSFYNAVDIISNDIAKLPKHVYQKTLKGSEKLDTPVNYLINVEPNKLYTAFDFWKVVVLTVILKGNAYAYIHRNKNGEVVMYEFLGSDDEVHVYLDEGNLTYRYDGEEYDGEDILHFKAFTLDGIMGIPVIRFAAASLGVSLDSQNYVSSIYKDRGVGYGVIESDQDVKTENKIAIEDGFTAKMSSGNKFRVPLLDSGMKYKSISVTPAEAQFIETDKRGILEVCRWLNIAPHKLKVLDNANFSNIYHQSTEHVQDSILPWVVRFEQELQRKFFGKINSDYYIKFNEKMLLRGDLDARQKFYTAAIYAGFMSRNEVRELEDMNPIPGLDEPLQPVNMETLSQVLNNNENKSKDDKKD